MQTFPYPINIIPITYSITKEIENIKIENINANKNKELIFILNLPPEDTTLNNTKILNLLKKHLINKIQKLYNIKIELSIEKLLLKEPILDKNANSQENQFILKIKIT